MKQPKPSNKSILASKQRSQQLIWKKFSTGLLLRQKNVSVLQDYALLLCGCNNAMSDLRELDMSANLKVVISKLPFKLRERFRSIACGIHQKQKLKPNFNDVYFVKHQLKLLSDPVFRDIQTTERGMHIQ